MKKFILKEQNEVERRINLVQQKLNLYPKGNLSIRKNGKYNRWFLVSEDGDRDTLKYDPISAKNKEFIAQMSMKNLFLFEYQFLQEYSRILTSFIDQMNDLSELKSAFQSKQSFYSEVIFQYNREKERKTKRKREKRNEHKNNIMHEDTLQSGRRLQNSAKNELDWNSENHIMIDSEVREFTKVGTILNGTYGMGNDQQNFIVEWKNAPFRSSSMNPDKKKNSTLSGILVRSKSEALIADVLYRNGIPFRYECELVLANGKVVYPDFTILCPWNKKIYYWEHFGLMDDYDYRQKTYRKLAEYGETNIIPNINMITTFETLECPLSSNLVEDIVLRMFR